MTVNDHICRDCGAVRRASAAELEFGRVFCAVCGGTCDPCDRAIRDLEKCREVRIPRQPTGRRKTGER